tara:strand:+ start:1289 stop:2422 length:1134 start_codon:yes stop_codon:yes gene_type:complete
MKQPSDKLIYNIQNENFFIHINNKFENTILKEIENLKSDNKIFFVYDSNINPKILKNLIKFLRKTGNIIIIKKLNGNKFNKNRKQLFEIIDHLIKEKFTKKSIMLSMGGGVIGDLSALAASLYLRGLIYFHIPTTMTSIVDSCIGGKTGINHNNVINSIGNYYHAKSVFIDYNIIKDLPQREYNAGISEILKCCIINKGLNINYLRKNKKLIVEKNMSLIKKLIFFALKTKIKFFKDDVFEKKKRLNLNFGHTFAHAIEMSMIKNKKEIFRHGEAVGLGMLCELKIANKYKLFKDLSLTLKELNLPNHIKVNSIKEKNLLQNKIYKNVFLDKKKINKNPRYIHIKNIGNCSIKELTNYHKINDVIFDLIKVVETIKN